MRQQPQRAAGGRIQQAEQPPEHEVFAHAGEREIRVGAVFFDEYVQRFQHLAKGFFLFPEQLVEVFEGAVVAAKTAEEGFKNGFPGLAGRYFFGNIEVTAFHGKVGPGGFVERHRAQPGQFRQGVTAGQDERQPNFGESLDDVPFHAEFRQKIPPAAVGRLEGFEVVEDENGMAAIDDFLQGCEEFFPGLVHAFDLVGEQDLFLLVLQKGDQFVGHLPDTEAVFIKHKHLRRVGVGQHEPFGGVHGKGGFADAALPLQVHRRRFFKVLVHGLLLAPPPDEDKILVFLAGEAVDFLEFFAQPSRLPELALPLFAAVCRCCQRTYVLGQVKLRDEALALPKFGRQPQIGIPVLAGFQCLGKSERYT